MYEVITSTQVLASLVNSEQVSVEHYTQIDESYLEAHCYSNHPDDRPLLNDCNCNPLHLYWITSDMNIDEFTAKMLSMFGTGVIMVRSYDAHVIVDPYRFTYIAFELQEAFEGNYERSPWWQGRNA